MIYNSIKLTGVRQKLGDSRCFLSHFLLHFLALILHAAVFYQTYCCCMHRGICGLNITHIKEFSTQSIGNTSMRVKSNRE